MSELKTYKMVDEKYCTDCVCVIPFEVYLKSEADNVIAHHKYKRCLAMARWCENAILGWMGYKESFSSHQRYVKVMLFTKWHKRWLKIAEKFKE